MFGMARAKPRQRDERGDSNGGGSQTPAVIIVDDDEAISIGFHVSCLFLHNI